MRSSSILVLLSTTTVPIHAFIFLARSRNLIQYKNELIRLNAYAYSPQLDRGYLEYEDFETSMPPILAAYNDPYDNLLQRMRLPEPNDGSVVKKLEDRLESLTKSLRDSSIVQYLDNDSYADHHQKIRRDSSLFDRDVENRLPNKKFSLIQKERDDFADYFNPSRQQQQHIQPMEYVPPVVNLPSQIFGMKAPTKVQGGSLQTWTFNSDAVEAAHICMKTDGRPLDADIELWQGPDNTPCKMRVYVEDGSQRYFSAMIATPRGSNTVALRNIGQVEFPLDAQVVADTNDIMHPSTDMKTFTNDPTFIQGGALRIFEFEAGVESIQILLNTDGRPLNARVELLQGPNTVKQIVELYAEDGMDRPFLMILETPGSGNAIRIINTSPIEFPLTAGVEAYEMNEEFNELEPEIGGDTMDGFLSLAKSYF